MIKIGILTQDPPATDNTLLMFKSLETKLNIKTYVFDPKYLSLYYPNLEKGKILYYKGKRYSIDVLIPRISGEINLAEFLLSINTMDYIRNLTDIKVINYTKGMLIANDKFWQGEYISSKGYKIPSSVLIANKEAVDQVLEEFEYPLIVKQQFGYGGEGVALVESERSARSVISSFLSHRIPIVVQEFLPDEHGGRDFRVYVVGQKAVRGIERRARQGDFRANVNLGGTKRRFKITKELADMAIDIAQLVGLEIAAVDFLLYKGEYYFLEINKSPAMKKDLAMAEIMLTYAKDRVRGKIII